MTDRLELTKFHGAGNDFLVLLDLEGSAPPVGSEVARRVCDRHRGIGADGLIRGSRATVDSGAAVRFELWNAADAAGERLFPHEFFYRLLDQPGFSDVFQIDPKNSWMIAAKEKNLPIFVPGWEDSTLGNMYAAHCIRGLQKDLDSQTRQIKALKHAIKNFQTTPSCSAVRPVAPVCP